jgi:hypothetical protein
MDSNRVEGHRLFHIIGRKSAVALSVYIIGLIQNIADFLYSLHVKLLGFMLFVITILT